MHRSEGPQQSLAASHFSPSSEHPAGEELQTFPDPLEGQKPPQQSLPDWHATPSALHGLSAQYPRMLIGSIPFDGVVACPGR